MAEVVRCMVEDLLAKAGVTSLSIETTDVVYSQAFVLRTNVSHSVEILNSSATADLKVELEVSNNLPATEGAADSNFVLPESSSAIIANLTDTNVHIGTVSLVPAKYGRFRITGNVGNIFGTIIRLNIITIKG